MRVKDNTQTPKEAFRDVSKLSEKILNKTLGQLAKEGVFVFPPKGMKETEDLEDDQFVLQSFGIKYRTSNVMGFLGFENERLVIASRFSPSGDSRDYFLHYMLDRVLAIPSIIKFETDADQDNRLLNLLFFLFPYYLRQALRKGLFKTYIRRNYNDSNVKGTIDVPRHIAKNIPFLGRIAYSQREHSYDNHLTELIRHTIEYVKAKPIGRRVLATVKEEARLVVDATQRYSLSDRRKILEQNKRTVVRHAYFHEYRDLQRLCVMILENRKMSFSNRSNQVFGILFDGAWLWEEYLNTLIGDAYYHPRNKAGVGRHHLFEGGKGHIYPDFIGRNTQARIIADAKYKPSDDISGHDYSQLLAYMFRFDSKKGFYLYPYSGIEKVNRLEMLNLKSGTNFEQNTTQRSEKIQVHKLGLEIPTQMDSYDAFVSEMKKNEGKLKMALFSI